MADPEVRLQVGAEIMAGRARTTDGDEKKRLWRQMAQIWPQYDKYQEKTDRLIPVVVIDPI